MPSRSTPVTPWTPAFVADAVAATLKRAVEHDLHHAISEVARERGLSSATIDEWVARARAVPAAPVPPGLVTCHDCDHPMILVQLPGRQPVYLCMPACGRAPLPAQALRDTVAQAVLHRAPHLVPPGKIQCAAAYAPGGIHRVAVGAGSTDLHITWRSEPRQLVGPRMSMAQRLTYVRARADHGDHARAIEALQTGLLHTDPTDDLPPPWTSPPPTLPPCSQNSPSRTTIPAPHCPGPGGLAAPCGGCAAPRHRRHVAPSRSWPSRTAVPANSPKPPTAAAISSATTPSPTVPGHCPPSPPKRPSPSSFIKTGTAPKRVNSSPEPPPSTAPRTQVTATARACAKN